MSGEPKTLTPREALRLLRERGMELTFDSNDATPWAVYRDRGEYLNEYLHFGQSEEEVLSFALGVPVVARDEAAELRAAIKEWADAEDEERLAQIAWEGYRTEASQERLKKARNALHRSSEALRRLAGGENEK